jgi:hypothetical protein
MHTHIDIHIYTGGRHIGAHRGRLGRGWYGCGTGRRQGIRSRRPSRASESVPATSHAPTNKHTHTHTHTHTVSLSPRTPYTQRHSRDRDMGASAHSSVGAQWVRGSRGRRYGHRRSAPRAREGWTGRPARPPAARAPPSYAPAAQTNSVTAAAAPDPEAL